jgi:hypothetical protein
VQRLAGRPSASAHQARELVKLSRPTFGSILPPLFPKEHGPGLAPSAPQHAGAICSGCAAMTVSLLTLMVLLAVFAVAVAWLLAEPPAS